VEVHHILGPGFLEAVYQAALEHELTLRGIPFERQKRLAVVYKDQIIGEYIADLVIDGKIILELKAVSKLTPAHEAQAHHYLAATGLRLAILLNPSTGLRASFGAASLEQKRIIRGYEE
jgi:GxxExxY protein